MSKDEMEIRLSFALVNLPHMFEWVNPCSLQTLQISTSPGWPVNKMWMKNSPVPSIDWCSFFSFAFSCANNMKKIPWTHWLKHNNHIMEKKRLFTNDLSACKAFNVHSSLTFAFTFVWLRSPHLLDGVSSSSLVFFFQIEHLPRWGLEDFTEKSTSKSSWVQLGLSRTSLNFCTISSPSVEPTRQ